MNREIGPVSIRTIHDIRKAIIPFTKDIKENKVDFTASVNWNDEDGKKVTTEVSAYSSDVSVRTKLLEGFEQVKEQKKLWDNVKNTLEEDEFGASLPSANVDDFDMPVDRIIKHRLGGKREGMTVVWYLENKKIVFDPFTKKLEEENV